jgi:deoxyribodipyrimidine photo-lyase
MSTDVMQAYPPSRAAGVERIKRVQPAAYARTRNHLSGAVTGLSPYLTHGLLTLEDVLAEVLQRGSLDVGHKLVFELGWREFFRHVWQHAGTGILSSLHPGPLPEQAYARELPADIRQACTGVPVIDEAVRTLYATGMLHNHARMWLASYVVHLRHVHWRAGADWLVAHLLDGDLASNHLSWQWVAGTGSHKPYLFNAENVARYAPASWHSPGSVVDQSYEDLDRMARTSPGILDKANHAAGTLARATHAARLAQRHALAEPDLRTAPPPDMGVKTPDASQDVPCLSGRTVWLVHPWALRSPPPGFEDAVVVGVYPREHHAAWPWPEVRWRWVDAAMAELTSQRWWVSSQELASALAGAARVHRVDDPHISAWLEPVAQLDPAPRLFPQVERPCASFSQWWTRATRGLKRAQELL